MIFGISKKLTAENNELKSENEDLKSKAGEWKERVENLERSLEKQFGIEVRKNVTVVNSDFSKHELALMLAGINSILKSAKNSDDIKFYFNLIDKIQNLINNMEEE